MTADAERLVDRTCSGPVADWTDTSVNGSAGRELDFVCGGFAGREVFWVDGDRGWAISGEPAVVELMLETLRTN
ncbi:MAG: hypothetical protein H0U52_00480 [Chloroflexi bacterium]|nr:hypothetical protein [Chloroflexota bacterium]